jgi:hypothetical protein
VHSDTTDLTGHPMPPEPDALRRNRREPPHGPALSSTIRRASRGVVVGGSVAALVVIGRQSGALDGGAGLVLGALLALALPTSRLLSRRILFTGCLMLGWIPVLWWWNLPTGGLGRVTVLLALVAGSLGGWISAGAYPLNRARHLIPSVAWADLIPVAGLAASLAILSPWVRVRSGASAVAMLTLGWDHSAHYDMTEMIRAHGVVISGAGTPPGGGLWSYVNYPQGYHTATAALMELTGSASVGTPSAEVALYARSMGLLSAIAIVIVVAGIAALPSLRRRPLVAAIAAGVVAAAFLWGPGGLALADGFPNFFLACALLAAVPLIAIPIARWPAPVPLAALAGAVVGIAHSWALLLTLAVPIALVILLPMRRARARSSRVQWFVCGAIALATATGILVAIEVIRVQPLTNVMVIAGGVTKRPLSELGLVMAATFLAVGLLAALHPRPWSPAVTRTVWTVLGPATGVAFALWIASVQRSTGDLGYYFWKYAIALELVSLVVTCVAAATLVTRTPALTSSRIRSATLASLVVVGVAAGFGAPYPSIAALSHLPESPELTARIKLWGVSLDNSPEIQRLLAASTRPSSETRRSVYLPIGNTGWPSPAVVGQWHAALAGEWTDDLNKPIGILLDADLSPSGAPALARRVLDSDAALVVTVAPEYAAAVRDGVGPELRDRVLTW